MGVTRMIPFKVFIPGTTRHGLLFGGIAEGEYDCNGIVELLRSHKDNPEAIQFIADMMEE